MHTKSENLFDLFFCHCLVNESRGELGSASSWMLTVIALQRRKQFKNHELKDLCGFKSTDRLVRARNKAIEAGWLKYTPGGKTEGGMYELVLPLTLFLKAKYPSNATPKGPVLPRRPRSSKPTQ